MQHKAAFCNKKQHFVAKSSILQQKKRAPYGVETMRYLYFWVLVAGPGGSGLSGRCGEARGVLGEPEVSSGVNGPMR